MKPTLRPKTTTKFPNEPRWNSANECTICYWAPNGQEYTRGKLKIMEWTQHLFSSLHPDCQIVYNMLMDKVCRAADDQVTTFYIDRFLLLSPEHLQKMMKFVEDKYHYKLPDPTKTYHHCKISYLFMKEARQYSKWDKYTWNHIRGKVAFEHQWSVFWCQSLLNDLRIIWMANNKQKSFHGIGLSDQEVMQTAEVSKFLRVSFDTAKTSVAMSNTVGEYHQRQQQSGQCGFIKYCDGIIWLYFGIPITTPYNNNGMMTCRITGDIKSGSLSVIAGKHPVCVFGPKKLKPFIDTNTVLKNLYEKYMSLVCFFLECF